MIDTRAEAHEKAKKFSPSMSRQIMAELLSNLKTGSELAEDLGADVVSVRARLSDLKKKKQIYIVGQRKNKKGNNEDVYRRVDTMDEDWYDNVVI